MPQHPLKETLESGGIAFGSWAAIPSSVTAEVAGGTGFHYVCVDMQHGLVDYVDSVPMLQAITIGGSTPLVRVPENQAGHIGKALDAGALGVVVPMVNSVAECEAAVAATHYAPIGTRSYGPSRALPVHGSNYLEASRTDVWCIPMIETAAAIEAIDDIVSVPTINAIYVGPSDLAVSMGYEPGSEKPGFLDALDEIVAACKRHDVAPGIHTTMAVVQDRLERGFRMVTLGNDLVALRTKLAADLETARRGASGDGDAIY